MCREAEVAGKGSLVLKARNASLRPIKLLILPATLCLHRRYLVVCPQLLIPPSIGEVADTLKNKW